MGMAGPGSMAVRIYKIHKSKTPKPSIKNYNSYFINSFLITNNSDRALLHRHKLTSIKKPNNSTSYSNSTLLPNEYTLG